MAVERSHFETYEISMEPLVKAIQEILDKGCYDYSYVKTEYNEHSMIFHTKSKPTVWPMMAATKFVIELKPAGNHIVVGARTRSQLFVMGDIFNFYQSYINDFFESLNKFVESANNF